jgi:hypothetical protein
MALTYNDLLKQLDAQAEAHKADPRIPAYTYVETGKYKPYRIATVLKAKREGHRVEGRGSVFYVYPLGSWKPYKDNTSGQWVVYRETPGAAEPVEYLGGNGTATTFHTKEDAVAAIEALDAKANSRV